MASSDQNASGVGYKLVIFDFDGTLADSASWCLRTMDRLADEFGFTRLSECDAGWVRSLDAGQVLKHLSAPAWKLPRIVRRIRRLAAEECEQISVFRGVESLLEDLKGAEVRVAMVSSNSESTIRKVLGPINAARIGYYSCGASVFGKASKLRSVLRRCNVDCAEAIYIGDEVRDAEAASQAKMDFGAVAWGYTNPEALLRVQPRFFFKDLQDVFVQIMNAKPRITACGRAPMARAASLQ